MPSLLRRSSSWAKLLLVLVSRALSEIPLLLPQTQQVKLPGKQDRHSKGSLGTCKTWRVTSSNICDWLGSTPISWCTTAPLIVVLFSKVGPKTGERKYLKVPVNMVIGMFCFLNYFQSSTEVLHNILSEWCCSGQKPKCFKSFFPYSVCKNLFMGTNWNKYFLIFIPQHFSHTEEISCPPPFHPRAI